MLPALILMLQTPVAEELERIRAAFNLPSICAGAILDNRIVSLDAVGVRRLGSNERATVDDAYHLGSNTKSFTAALTARLVKRGNLAWDAPLSQLLPEAGPYGAVTPRLLIQHRAGLTGETYLPGMPDWYGSKAPIATQRQAYSSAVLAVPPATPPGTAFAYSNAGYVVLGAALERRTRRSWEDLLTTELLRPLGLKSAGFGAADAGGRAEPVGHVEEAGKLVPAPGVDNAPVLGPAGTLHMSVGDMLRWGAFQADEGRHGGPLDPASFAVLHTPPPGSDYAGGLNVLPRAWAGGNALYHRGSNTANLQAIWIAPAKRFAVVVSTNAYTKDADEAVDEVCGLLIGRFCPK